MWKPVRISAMPTRRSRKRKRAEYTAMLDRRSDDGIVEEMLAVLKPPSDQREAIRAEVMSLIEHIRGTVSGMRDFAPERFRSAKKRKKELGDYFKALRTAYGKFRKLPLAHDAYFLQKTFRQQLLEEIVRIKYHFDEIKVGH